MNETHAKGIITYLINDLVQAGAIATKRGDNRWVITKPVAGLTETDSFASQDDLARQLADRYAAQVSSAGVLRVAS